MALHKKMSQRFPLGKTKTHRGSQLQPRSFNPSRKLVFNPTDAPSPRHVLPGNRVVKGRLIFPVPHPSLGGLRLHASEARCADQACSLGSEGPRCHPLPQGLTSTCRTITIKKQQKLLQTLYWRDCVYLLSSAGKPR